MASLCAHATEEQQDTAYFFNTWEQVIKMKPATMLVNPYISFTTAYDIYVDTDDPTINKKIEKEYMAELLGGEFWLINTVYLKKNFKGDTRNLKGYLPLFFDEKVAYVKDMEETGPRYSGGYDIVESKLYYYYIDFVQHKVRKVNHKVLKDLLMDYPDLLMRYESMKDYKTQSVIQDYFLKYVERASEDVMRPNILDLVN